MKNYLAKISSLLILSLMMGACNQKKEKWDEERQAYTDSITYYKNAYEAANYFSIEANENAQRVFENVGVNAAMQKVQFDLNQLNKQEQNPLLPETKNGIRAYMNKAAVLNNKWIILDYYQKDQDEQMVGVGEVLVEYHFHTDRPCEFFVLSTQVYE